nr:uncharacterized mitochondrial protein AtMg00810-like [Tanacetum cinerariifolium]
MSNPHPKRNFVPRTVLMRSGFKTLNIARQNSSRAVVSVNTARQINTAYPRPTVNSARPMSNVFNRAHSHDKRPINNRRASKNSKINQKVNIVRAKHVNTARPKVVLNVVQGNQGNLQLELQEKGIIDSGCSRHMTRNMSYLSEYEETDGGYVAFGRDPKGGKITGKGKISTDTKCVVLSPDFKLLDESQVLLRVPRKNNMYNVDLKNVAPSGGLTCLFAKATLDESNFWQRRLGFSWVFLATKDETSGILKGFITGIENFIDHKVKIIRCDNGTEFKNKEMNQFCEKKRIKREFSFARTSQQNGTEVVNTACYVQNRVLLIKPHNKTPYELFHDRTPSLSFMRPFGCPVTILNTLDPLGKFDGKTDEGFFIGYSVNSKAFRVSNSRTRIVEETLHIIFLENKLSVAGSGPTWLFDIDTLTKSMNYKPVVAGNQSNDSAVPRILLVMDSNHQGKRKRRMLKIHRMKIMSLISNVAGIKDNVVDENTVNECVDDPNMPNLEEIVYSDEDEDETCTEFEKMMHKKFQMSSMGDLTFFLGLQVTQKDNEIFISQEKYVDEILMKFGFLTVKTASTPMETSKPLMKDENAEDVDVYLYRSMIGSLMYLTSSRPDIMFDVYACARFQVTHKVSHLYSVKRIFRYLKGQPKLGLWYPKDSPFNLEAYTDNDYAGARLDRKSTTGGC